MKPVDKQWNVVVSGNWNPRIFTPEWVGKHLFDDPESIQMEVILAQGVTQFRLISSQGIIHPIDGKIIVFARDATTSALTSASKIAAKALDKLPHTPVTGLGINLGFEETSPSSQVLRLFDHPDSADLVTDGFTIGRTETTRALVSEKGYTLNLKGIFQDGIVNLDFNYHFELKSATDIVTRIDQGVEEFSQTAISLVENCYGLYLEAEEEDN